MKKLLLSGICFSMMVVPAYAQWGDMLKNVQNNPALTQQKPIQEVLTKIQNVSAIIAQLPLNSGKMEFVKAAIPLLTQANLMSKDSLNSVQKGNPLDKSQISKVGGILDQVKSLASKKWSAEPLQPAQLKTANTQIKQATDLLGSILKNETDVLKKITQLPTK